MLKRKRCRCCKESFQPNPHTWKTQKTCLKKACRKTWALKKQKKWASLHPQYHLNRKAKRHAWAKSYPNYWQHYRATHPDYCERDNTRRAKAIKRQRCSAKQTVSQEAAVEKLQNIQALATLECSAKQTVSDRRVDGILDYLLWTVKEGCSAKQKAIASLGALTVG